MTQQRGLLGIEIRPKSIAWAFAEQYNASPGVRIQRGGVLGCAESDRVRAFSGLLEAERLSGAACNLVLSVDQYATYVVEKPPVEASELAEALKWRVADMAGFPVEEVILDLFEFPPDAAFVKGKKDFVNVVVARKSELQSLIDFVRQVGLRIEVIDVMEMAMRNLLLMAKGREKSGYGVLHLENGSGRILLVADGMSYLSRRVNVDRRALEQISADVDPGRMTDAMTIASESNEGEKQIDRLAIQVQRTLDYYETQMGQAPVSTLLVCPLEGLTHRFVAALDQRLNIPASRFPVESLPLTQGSPSVNSGANLVAMGAALRLGAERIYAAG